MSRLRERVGSALISSCASLPWLCAGACGDPERATGSGTVEDDHEHESEEHGDEVTLTSEAIAAEGLVVEPAAQRVLQPSARFPARIAFNAERMAHVGSPVRGRVVEVLAKLGADVEQGEALLVIDSPDLGEAQSDYLQRESALATAVPAVALARNAFERGKALHDLNQGLPLTEVQKREAELLAAEAAQKVAHTAVEAARHRLRLLGMSDGSLDRLSATGAIDPRYTVRAPLSGQVIEHEVTLGELVNPDREALLVLADLSHLWILADVPDGRLADVRVGAPARVHLGATEEHWCDGRVALISPAVDPATRTAEVRSEANDRHPELRPGVFAQTEIAIVAGDGEEPVPVLSVPQSALQLVEGESSVFVAVPGEPGTFARRTVVAGKPVGGFVPIHSGLADGEAVVVHGAFLLKAELGKGSAEHQH